MRVLSGHQLNHLGEAKEVIVDVQVIVLSGAAAKRELVIAGRADVEHELHPRKQAECRGRRERQPAHVERALRLDPHEDRRADGHADDAAPTTLRQERDHDARQQDRKPRLSGEAAARDQQRCQAWQHVAEILHLVEEGVPAAQLAAAPGRRPALLTEVREHHRDIEPGGECVIEHAEQEAHQHQSPNGPRVHFTLRDIGDHFGQRPRLAGDTGPHAGRGNADGEEGIPNRCVRRVAEIVCALDQVEKQPEHETERDQVFTVQE